MNRESGSLLVELLVGCTLLTVGLLGFCTSFASNFSATAEVEARDAVRVAFDNVVESLRTADFTTLYQNYNNASYEVPGLKSSYGTAYATVASSFYTNETALPAQFGPLTDMDGTGRLDNTNCTTDYKLLPCRLTISYLAGNRMETRERYIVLRDD